MSGDLVLLKPTQVGTHTISSNATAEEGYHTETFVEVEVFDESPEKRAKFHSEVMAENIINALKMQGAEISNLNIATSADPTLGKYLAYIKRIIEKGHRLKE